MRHAGLSSISVSSAGQCGCGDDARLGWTAAVVSALPLRFRCALGELFNQFALRFLGSAQHRYLFGVDMQFDALMHQIAHHCDPYGVDQNRAAAERKSKVLNPQRYNNER